jgi:polyketide cyclase/dehydrase/lipid transport protein
MIEVSASACIDAVAPDVWDALARLEDIRLWSEAVLDARCEGAVPRGLGATRACDLRGGVTISERWVAWDEGRSFTNEGSGIPLIAYARNEWTVQPAGQQTVLVSRATVVLRGGRASRLLEPLVRRQIRRVAARTLAAFEYVLKHGEAPTVRHSKLSKPAVAC